MVYLLIISSYLIGMLLIFPYHLSDGYILALVFSVLFFIFSYSYARIIIDGPGYYPFYYPNHSRRPTFSSRDSSSLLHSDDLSPSGIVSTDAQKRWRKGQPKPNRCIYSTIGRRIVIRPDHFCGWTSTWIGKRNHKFFLLFNLWGFIYISIFTLFDIARIMDEVNRPQVAPFFSVYLVYAVLGGSFLLLTGTFVLSHCRTMCDGTTSWEEWNHVQDGFDRGCVKNTEDMCGPCDQWYLYPLPVSPWTGRSNDELVADYPPYKSRSGVASSWESLNDS
jgi:hypothetical protein